VRTLADLNCRAAFCERLSRLTPQAQRLWGRMSAHQMVCHLNDSFRAVTGELKVNPAITILSSTVIRWVALHTPLPWPKGVTTPPEIDQVAGGGTAPQDWLADIGKLRGWIQNFLDCPRFSIHPIFGPLSRREWGIWGYRHVDHHFRQFGV
jgi:hypothetical protein